MSQFLQETYSVTNNWKTGLRSTKNKISPVRVSFINQERSNLSPNCSKLDPNSTSDFKPFVYERDKLGNLLAPINTNLHTAKSSHIMQQDKLKFESNKKLNLTLQAKVNYHEYSDRQIDISCLNPINASEQSISEMHVNQKELETQEFPNFRVSENVFQKNTRRIKETTKNNNMTKIMELEDHDNKKLMSKQIKSISYADIHNALNITIENKHQTSEHNISRLSRNESNLGLKNAKNSSQNYYEQLEDQAKPPDWQNIKKQWIKENINKRSDNKLNKKDYHKKILPKINSSLNTKYEANPPFASYDTLNQDFSRRKRAPAWTFRPLESKIVSPDKKTKEILEENHVSSQISRIDNYPQLSQNDKRNSMPQLDKIKEKILGKLDNQSTLPNPKMLQHPNLKKTNNTVKHKLRLGYQNKQNMIKEYQAMKRNASSLKHKSNDNFDYAQVDRSGTDEFVKLKERLSKLSKFIKSEPNTKSLHSLKVIEKVN